MECVMISDRKLAKVSVQRVGDHWYMTFKSSSTGNYTDCRPFSTCEEALQFAATLVAQSHGGACVTLSEDA